MFVSRHFQKEGEVMKEKSVNTKLLHAGENALAKKIAKGVSVPKVLPIYMTSVYSFDDVPSLDAVYAGEATGYIYGRNGTPNQEAAAECLAICEGTDDALLFGSGMAAITTCILAQVSKGDHIVSSPVLYGGVYDFLKNEMPRFGVEVTFVEFDDISEVEAAIKPNTKLIYTETIVNPTMNIYDLDAVAEVAHKHGCKLVVDNTFATGSVCRPMEHGTDIVVYSTTKFLGGHSDIVGGAIVSDQKTINSLRHAHCIYGGQLGPMECWLLCRSMRTLDMRVAKHSENALKVAEFLEKHPKIEKVYYPGLASSKYRKLGEKLFIDNRFGGMMSADIAGGEEGASKFIALLPTIKFVPSLAGVSTTLSYPAKTSHRAYNAEELKAAGISMGTIRFSIGLEDADDIIEEFKFALDQL